MKRTLLLVAILFSSIDLLHAWSGEGHRLVGLIAAQRLTPVAKQNVEWLLGTQTLADVASWADVIRSEQTITSPWHYVNVPPGADDYSRDRDCPSQPGVTAGSTADRWRDCLVDRLQYWLDRLGKPSIDRADRATALKFVVHFIGDIHQPLHVIGPMGGNDIPVRVFGDSNCSNDPSRPYQCNLHGVWDAILIERHKLDEAAYLVRLDALIADKQLVARSTGTPLDWTRQSIALARASLVSPEANIDADYARRFSAVIDEQLALAGLRLAAELNRILSTAPRLR